MYIKTKSYYDIEEYVADLTGYIRKEKNSDVWLFGGMGYILAVLVLTNLMMESVEEDASFAVVLLILAFPVVMIAGLPKVYRMITKDDDDTCFLDVKTVIDSIPTRNEWKDIDQAFVNLMIEKKISWQEIAEIREKRKACNFGGYGITKNILEYAKFIDKCQLKNGYPEKFKDLICEMEEQFREEARRKEEQLREEARRKEEQLREEARRQEEQLREEAQRQKEAEKARKKIATQNAKFIWKRLKDLYSDEGINKEKILGQRRYIMLETEYKKVMGIEKEKIIFDVENKVTDSKLIDYIDCFYLIKATKGERKKIRELLKRIINTTTFNLSKQAQANKITAIMRTLKKEDTAENITISENKEQGISDEAVIELLAYMIKKELLFTYHISVYERVRKQESYYNHSSIPIHYTTNTYYTTSSSDLEEFLEMAQISDPEDIEMLADEYGIDLDDIEMIADEYGIDLDSRSEYYDRVSDSSSDLEEFLEMAQISEPEDIEMLADEYGIDLDDIETIADEYGIDLDSTSEYYDRASDSSYDYIETSFVDGCDELYDAYGDVKD